MKPTLFYSCSRKIIAHDEKRSSTYINCKWHQINTNKNESWKREYVRIKKVSTANNRRYAHLLTHSVYPTRKYTHILYKHIHSFSHMLKRFCCGRCCRFFAAFSVFFFKYLRIDDLASHKKGQRIKKNDDSAIIIFLHHRLLLFNPNAIWTHKNIFRYPIDLLELNGLSIIRLFFSVRFERGLLCKFYGGCACDYLCFPFLN